MSDHSDLVGVIYETETLALWRIVIDSPDLNVHLLPGSSLATAPKALGYSLDRAYEIIRLATGREPPR